MRPTIKITLPEPPSANVYWRTGVRYGKRDEQGNRGKARAQTFVSKKAEAFKENVFVECKKLGVRPLSGDVAVRIDWYRARRQGDTDNRVKPLFDALQGFAFHDDAQVQQHHVYRHESDSAYVVVQVWPACEVSDLFADAGEAPA